MTVAEQPSSSVSVLATPQQDSSTVCMMPEEQGLDRRCSSGSSSSCQWHASRYAKVNTYDLKLNFIFGNYESKYVW